MAFPGIWSPFNIGNLPINNNRDLHVSVNNRSRTPPLTIDASSSNVGYLTSNCEQMQQQLIGSMMMTPSQFIMPPTPPNTIQSSYMTTAISPNAQYQMQLANAYHNLQSMAYVEMMNTIQQMIAYGSYAPLTESTDHRPSPIVTPSSPIKSNCASSSTAIAKIEPIDQIDENLSIVQHLPSTSSELSPPPSSSSTNDHQHSRLRLSSQTPHRRHRRNRIVFSAEHLKILEQAFKISRYPSIHDREQLAKQISVSENRVQIWFQNRRSKYRRIEKPDNTVANNDIINNNNSHIIGDDAKNTINSGIFNCSFIERMQMINQQQNVVVDMPMTNSNDNQEEEEETDDVDVVNDYNDINDQN